MGSVVITITFEDVVSLPTVSAASASLGSALTISTNRSNKAATHTLSYRFGNASGLIGSDVGDAVSWTPPLSLASEIPRATSGVCTITCNSFINGKMTGSRTCTVTLTVPSTVVPSISSVTLQDTNETIAAKIGAFVKSLSTLSVTITAEGIYGSSISSYRTTLDGATYTAASFTAGKKLSAAGDMTLTVNVTDSRGRTATYTSTIQVLDYAVPSIRRFSVERCNADGSSAQVDGTKARFSFQGSISPLNNKNSVSCVVYYKLKNAEAWTQAYAVNAASYTLAISNQLLGQTYDALSSYDVKIRLADYFQEAEQAVSIGTKGVILDFLADGTGIGIGKVAETPGAIECGWPLKLSDPLSIAYGGTGAASAENALAALGGVKKAGDTMTGNLRISESLYPSVFLLPTYNGTSSRTVLEGSYEGAASLAAWEDAAGDNRRMLEIRTKALQASLDWALVLRACEAGVWNNYRVFHSGMPSGVPVANGGTGAANAADARKNLGANNAGNLTTGTLPAARLKKHNNKATIMLSSSIQATLAGRFGNSEYGRSKKAGEELFFQYAQETGAKVAVYRFVNLMGHSRPKYNSAVSTFCWAVANDEPFTVNDRSTELELLYIDDLVEGMFDLLEGKEQHCEFDGVETVLQADGRYCCVPVTHKVTLGEIVDLLQEFKAQPTTLMMPKMPDGSFAKKLYSLYLTYLPTDKFKYALKMNVDNRGSFTELVHTADCGQVSINISKPGITKGQHWHNSKWELFIVVAGHGLIQERNINTGETVEFEVSGDKIEAVHMIPGWTHNIINLSETENLVTVMTYNEIFNPNRPDTFFEPV